VALLAWLAWPRAQAPAPEATPVAALPVAPTGPAVRDPVVPTPPLVEAPLDEPFDGEVPVDDDTAWAALDDEDAELYAWLADAPVAPDDGGDAL
jgi:hypothetical protein